MANRQLTEQQKRALVDAAIEARQKAYCPYSQFRVGAAVLDEDGHVSRGANIENSAYGATMCAERVAVFSAVFGGVPKIAAIAVAADTGDLTGLISPCGECRQVIAEFGDDILVLMADPTGRYETLTIGELLPKAFRLGGTDSER